MAESVYKFIEVVGSSDKSWQKAAEAAIAMASKTLRDLHIAEVLEMDIQIDEGKILSYRTKLKLSFKVQKKLD